MKKLKKKEIDRKLHVRKFNAILFTFNCYIQFLRLYYHNRQTLTDFHTSTADKIKTFIEKKYDEIINEYSNNCNKGDATGVSIIVNAIGEFVFDETWFCDGLKALYRKKKVLKFPRFKEEFNYQKTHDELFKFETKLVKGKTLNVALSYFPTPKIKTQYFKDFPLKKSKIFFFHHCYGLLHDELHEQILNEDILQWDMESLNNNLAIAEKIISE